MLVILQHIGDNTPQMTCAELKDEITTVMFNPAKKLEASPSSQLPSEIPGDDATSLTNDKPKPCRCVVVHTHSSPKPPRRNIL
jgi:hypothetical protein